MSNKQRTLLCYGLMALLLIGVGLLQGWILALTILNMCLISAIMSLGVNIQWGYAGLLNVGVMGFAALGGVAVVLVSAEPVHEAIEAGGAQMIYAIICLLVTLFALFICQRKLSGLPNLVAMVLISLVGFLAYRHFYDAGSGAIESINPASTGYLGGLGLHVLFSWLVGGALAAGAAFFIGKISLGLRSDYLAIATLGISEIVIAGLKFEDWLTRGVKNVINLPRPVPYEVDIQQTSDYLWLHNVADSLDISIIDVSSAWVKLCYAALFSVVLVILLYLSQRAINSPWGRMMRAIRDNETAAEAMGKDVKARHLQVFILGCAVVGIAGAMLVTLDSQFTPSSYQPLRYTFLIWVMVIVGGSGNNFGAVLGGFLIWFLWVEAEPLGLWLMDLITWGMADDNPLRIHLLASAAHMRLMTMGLILLLVLRFAPRGLIPEK